jgi:hypothetical protein
MDIIANGLKAREANIEQRSGALSYERLQHQRRIEEIDRLLAGLDGMITENAEGQNDLSHERELAKSQKIKEA